MSVAGGSLQGCVSGVGREAGDGDERGRELRAHPQRRLHRTTLPRSLHRVKGALASVFIFPECEHTHVMRGENYLLRVHVQVARACMSRNLFFFRLE